MTVVTVAVVTVVTAVTVAVVTVSMQLFYWLQTINEETFLQEYLNFKAFALDILKNVSSVLHT